MPPTSHAIVLALLVSLLGSAACTPNESQATQSKAAQPTRPRRIAVIPKGTSHEFWKAVESGARRADAEFDDVEIVWNGPSGEGATQEQIALVESGAEAYDALCLAPLDGRALTPVVRRILDRHIPVVIFDSALSTPNVPITAFVASPNRRGGEEAGAELARILGDTGNVIVLRYQMGSESTTDRENGCLAALSQHPGIHVISKDIYAGPDEAGAVSASETLLANFGPRLNGVFCPNESSTSGFLTALQRSGMAGKLAVVGFDLSMRIVQALESGALTATVAQDPETMGYQSVVAARDALDHKPVQARIETPQLMVRRDTLASPQVQRLLEPLRPR